MAGSDSLYADGHASHEEVVASHGLVFSGHALTTGVQGSPFGVTVMVAVCRPQGLQLLLKVILVAQSVVFK